MSGSSHRRNRNSLGGQKSGFHVGHHARDEDGLDGNYSQDPGSSCIPPQSEGYSFRGYPAQDATVPASSPSTGHYYSYSSSSQTASAGFDTEDPASSPTTDDTSLYSPLTALSTSPSAGGYSFDLAGLDTTADKFEPPKMRDVDDTEDLTSSIMTLNQQNAAGVLDPVPPARRPTLAGVGGCFEGETVYRSTHGGQEVPVFVEAQPESPWSYEGQAIMTLRTTSSMETDGGTARNTGDDHHPAASPRPRRPGSGEAPATSASGRENSSDKRKVRRDREENTARDAKEQQKSRRPKPR